MTGARDAWSAYWAQGVGHGCFPGAPPQVAKMLDDGWCDFARSLPDKASVLDIAAGNGAVMRTMLRCRPDLAVQGVDLADVGAPEGLAVRGGVDAAALPFPDGAFDAVTSQFGIEYCAPAALPEAVRVLRPRGARLRFVCHHIDSPAIAHNRLRLAAIEALAGAGLFTMARADAAGIARDPARLAAVAAARERHATQSIVDELPRALGQALRTPDPRGGVARIAAMADAETERLRAMIAAARDADAMGEMTSVLSDGGLPATARPIGEDEKRPTAWAVVGKR